MESMADPTMLSGIDENDPRSIAKWAKKMAKEMGEDMGDEIEAMAEDEFGKSKTSHDSTENATQEKGNPPLGSDQEPFAPN